MADFSRESMQEVFVFEMNQLVEQLEQIIIEEEESDALSETAINEIFRIMHTIKGSAAMMLYNNVADVSHKIEDMFFFIREQSPANIDYSELADIVLEGIDFIKEELGKMEAGQEVDGEADNLVIHVQRYLAVLKGEAPPEAATGDAQEETAPEVGLEITLFFEPDCGMESVRAYNVRQRFSEFCTSYTCVPADLEMDESEDAYIKKNGFKMRMVTDASEGLIRTMLEEVLFLREFIIVPLGAQAKIPASNFIGQGANNFRITVWFEDGCEMENVRAYTLIRNLEPIASDMRYEPSDILENDATIDLIRKNGFVVMLSTDEPLEKVQELINATIFLKNMLIDPIEAPTEESAAPISPVPGGRIIEPGKDREKTLKAQQTDSSNPANAKKQQPAKVEPKKATGSSMISINVHKLDVLLNLTGELVTSEAMVTQNPDLDGLELENFQKASRQLRKIINDIQDTVMSMRMVPLSPTFLKMHRIVRDMCKNLDKDVQLELIGEETEVDKNITEHISDPLMHIIRNSVDHGIENSSERESAGKNAKGVVVLEAKNAGGDVLITVKDDGAGIDRDRVMAKAKSNGMLKKDESEYTDREIYNFIFMPGFSTNENVTSYSGRGVGMDVVTTNIEQVGGSVIVDSEPGEGTTTTLKIPLTLAIINGMIVMLGGDKYTIPINTIKESFKITEDELLADPDGNEMVMVRGEMYNVLRLHEFFEMESEPVSVNDGIMMMLENDEDTICVLVDELIGEQQVVVKAIPKYIKKIKGISGCTLLGNGDISLIVDVAGFFND